MMRAARTAARIPHGRGAAAPVGLAPLDVANRYPVELLSLDLAGEEKRALLERADRAARAADARVTRVEVSLAEQIREILIATSDGRLVRDRQPLLRFGVRV